VANAILHQFDKKSAWRFLKLAMRLRAPEPAFRHVLLTLADYADTKGSCYPGYETLMADTGYTSDRTITAALTHWKSTGILSWKKGWGNRHKQVPNVYQFHEDVMEARIEQQILETAPAILETALASDETALTHSRNRTEEGMKPHSMRSKVPVEGPSKTERPSLEGSASLSRTENFTGEQERTAKQAQLEETALDAISSETALNAISSGTEAERFRRFMETAVVE
jgi:hypothetical protein